MRLRFRAVNSWSISLSGNVSLPSPVSVISAVQLGPRQLRIAGMKPVPGGVQPETPGLD
jgi:hypothetical protein